MSKQFLMVDYALLKLRGRYDGVIIGAEEMLLLSLIKNLSSNKKMKYPTCAASNAYLCSVLGIEERTLQRQMKKLEQSGFIKKYCKYEKGSYKTTVRLIYIQQDLIDTLIVSRGADTFDTALEEPDIIDGAARQEVYELVTDYVEMDGTSDVSTCQSCHPNNNIIKTIKENNYNNMIKAEPAKIPLDTYWDCYEKGIQYNGDIYYRCSGNFFYRDGDFSNECIKLLSDGTIQEIEECGNLPF